ncbi:MAG: hypothetical protein JSR85_06150 [Proteobacteria bacterium]|nr:hypothetical protein [Pseudomonadota bacterium]
MVKKSFVILGILACSTSLTSNVEAMDDGQRTLDSYFPMHPKYTLAAKREREEREQEEKRRAQAAKRRQSWKEWQYKVKSKDVF